MSSLFWPNAFADYILVLSSTSSRSLFVLFYSVGFLLILCSQRTRAFNSVIRLYPDYIHLKHRFDRWVANPSSSVFPGHWNAAKLSMMTMHDALVLIPRSCYTKEILPANEKWHCCCCYLKRFLLFLSLFGCAGRSIPSSLTPDQNFRSRKLCQERSKQDKCVREQQHQDCPDCPAPSSSTTPPSLLHLLNLLPILFNQSSLLPDLSIRLLQTWLRKYSLNVHGSAQRSMSMPAATGPGLVRSKVRFFIHLFIQLSLSMDYWQHSICANPNIIQNRLAGSTLSSLMIKFPSRLRTSALSALARKGSATRDQSFTVSLKISCFRVVTLPVAT